MKKVYSFLFSALFCLSFHVYSQCPGQAVIIAPTSDRSVCSGDSVMLYAATGNGFTYSWMVNNQVISGATDPYLISNFNLSGSYRVIVTNNSGCKDTSAARVITVNPLPSVVISSYQSIVCAGTSISITATVSGPGPITYNWIPFGSSLPVSTNESLSVIAENNYAFLLQVKDVNGCISEERGGFVVRENYKTDAGKDVFICPGSSAELRANNLGASSYEWSPITGVSDPNAYQPSVSPSVTTEYIVKGITYEGCFTTDTVIVNVVPDPKIVINKLWGIDTICKVLHPYDSLFLLASIQGSYKWFRNGVEVPNSTDAYFLAYDPGSYTAQYTGGVCTSSSISDPYVVAGCEGYGQISGTVFNDVNDNGSMDVSEKGLSEVWVYAGNRYGITDSLGNYLFYVAPGSYTLDFVLPRYSAKTFPSNPGNYTINVPIEGISFFPQNDFGIAKVIVKDLSLSISPGFARPGFDQTTWLYAVNNGSEMLDANIVFSYEPSLTFLSSNPAGVHNAVDHTITFNVTNFGPGNWLNYYVNFNIPVSTPLNSFLTFTADGTINGTDAFLADNIDTVSIMVRGSYDPNDKAVYPAGVGAENFIHSTDKMEYTIRFQNTGNASAITVAVKDTIDSDLNLSTFEMLGKSHACKISIDSNRVITWTFNNINLPDSTSDEKGSHGFIKYSLNQNQGNVSGTVIDNLASIYFDFNPPVITNEVSNTVDDSYFIVTGTKNSIDPAINQIKVYPNPARDQITINSLVDLNFKIVDLAGKQVLSGQTNTSVNVSGLSKGMYIMKLESGEGVHIQKLVIE